MTCQATKRWEHLSGEFPLHSGCDDTSMQLTHLAEQHSSDIVCFVLTLGVGQGLWKRDCFSKY